MSVLVTGITGFIGSRLGRRLVQGGHDVVAIVRAHSPRERIADYAHRLKLIEADLTDPTSYREALLEARPDWAFHLAWYGKTDRLWNGVENLECVAMTLSLARILASSGCRQMICAGSCAEYAWQHGFLSEDRSPLQPASLFGATKKATAEILASYAPQADFQVAWARLFFPFGPGEDASRMLPSVIRPLLDGTRVRFTHGEEIRDLIFVDDAISALLAIADARITGPINVGAGEPVRLRTMVELCLELTGRTLDDVSFGAIQLPSDEPPMVVADTRRLEATGWRPRFTLESALAESVEFWRKASESPGDDPL